MDNKKGLYGKYIITKADGTPVNDRCFILKPNKDPAAVKALQAYAAATEDEQLRHDLYAWVGAPDVVLKPGDKVIMTDREKLVELINYVREYSPVADFIHPYGAEIIADHLIANGVTVNDDCKACAEATQECIVGLQEKIAEMRKKLEWISVEDALPCMNKFVLVTDGSLVKEAYYNGRAEWICNGHDMEQGGVVITHWKHKPEPPKDE